MQKSKSAHQTTVGGIKTRKMTYDVIEGHLRWMTSVYLGKVTISLYQYKRWISLFDVHIHDDMHNILSMCISPAKNKTKTTTTKTPSSQVTGVETPWNTNFADMTLKAGHRSNKGHGRYNLEIFREDANFQRLGTHNFVTMSRIVRALFSENPRRGCINPRINLRTPQANDTIYLNYGYQRL